MSGRDILTMVLFVAVLCMTGWISHADGPNIGVSFANGILCFAFLKSAGVIDRS